MGRISPPQAALVALADNLLASQVVSKGFSEGFIWKKGRDTGILREFLYASSEECANDIECLELCSSFQEIAVIYTTNAIGSVNINLHKLTVTQSSFQNGDE